MRRKQHDRKLPICLVRIRIHQPCVEIHALFCDYLSAVCLCAFALDRGPSSNHKGAFSDIIEPVDRTVVKRSLKDSDYGRDREWWLSQSPQARLAEVERLRKAWYGDISGFKRVAQVVPLSRS